MNHSTAESPQLTIGQFARLTRLSTKALRVYDDIGLLRPVEVDPSNAATPEIRRATLG